MVQECTAKRPITRAVCRTQVGEPITDGPGVRGASSRTKVFDSAMPRLDDLPEVLTAADVVAYLRGIFGRNAVYELLHTQGIRNRRHGQKFLIPRAALREFVECRAEDSIAGTLR
jgi:hypothetical protein